MRVSVVAIWCGTAVCSFMAGCYSEVELRPLDIPLSPAVGHVRSPEFETVSPLRYDIVVGLQAKPTEEATCMAVVPDFAKEVARGRCKALVPPLGAIDWVVTRSGKVVAEGSTPAFSWEWPRNDDEIALYPRSVGGFYAEPGSRYVVELNIHPSPLALEQFHPRLQIRHFGK